VQPSADRRDDVSLAAGIGLAALGALLLLDQSGAIDVTLGWLGAMVAAVLGTVLLVSGLRDPAPPPPPSSPPRLARQSE
jgi:peptidoglycan/LPS O-acetylase OafA/YrhL